MLKAVALVMALVVVAGCGASRSYRRGQQAANAQQFDEAVEHYRQARRPRAQRAGRLDVIDTMG